MDVENGQFKSLCGCQGDFEAKKKSALVLTVIFIIAGLVSKIVYDNF
jgi:hypothetical protein